MRILFLNRWAGCKVGGTENHIKELAIRLAHRGHDVHILTTEGKQLKGIESHVKVWYVHRNRGEPPYSRSLNDDPRLVYYGFLAGLELTAKLFFLWLKNIKFDVVSVHCTLEALLMRLVRFLLRTPFVFCFEGYTPLEGRVAKAADFQIAISPTVAKNCAENYGYQPVVIPVGVDLIRFRKRSNKPPFDKNGKTTVLSVGRLGPEKDLPTFIKAAKLVSDRNPGFLFVIVGEGSERESLGQMVKELHLEHAVLFAGRVSDKDLPFFYQAADIFASTEDIASTGDQFLIVFLEAMASGVPIIWTSVGADAPKVEDWGIVVPPKRPDLLANGILNLSSDRRLQRKMRVKGLRIVERYAWRRLIEEYEQAYENAVARTQPLYMRTGMNRNNEKLISTDVVTSTGRKAT